MRTCILRLALVIAGSSSTLAQTVNVPDHVVEIYAQGIEQPTTMAFIGPGDVLVLQKDNGRVRRVIGGVLQPGFVLDVAVTTESERGLLGIALDPDFVNHPWVYLYYTEATVDLGPALGNRLYRYTWNGTALVDPRLLLDLPISPEFRHDGGFLLFAPDDTLFTVIGDLDRTGKLENHPLGADPDDTGVVLRTYSDASAPGDNPFYEPASPRSPLSRTYAYGIRNSFGLAIDPVTGALWDTENGPFDYDEVNRIDPGTNSGWTKIMGPDSRDAQGIADLWHAPGSFYSDPEFSWALTIGPAAIAFVANPMLGCAQRHDVLVGDANCGQLYRFEPDASRTGFSFTSPELGDRVADNQTTRCSGEMSEIVFGSGFGIVTDIETGPDGLLYLVSLDTGRIYRIVPALSPLADPDGDGVESACDCAPANGSAYAAPGEVPRLRLSDRAPTHIGWDAQNAVTGSGTTYRVVTGTLAALGTDGGFESACTLAAGLATRKLDDPRMPVAGSGFYYLVRASNACGEGTFGDGSGPADPRDPLDASSPSACP